MRSSIQILFGSLALLLSSICAVGQTNVADFSGTWVYKSGINTYKVEILSIKQSGEKIDVTEKYKKGDERPLTYYGDGRGETNTGIDGTTQIKSRTKWLGDRLYMLFEKRAPSLPPTLPPGVQRQRNRVRLTKDPTSGAYRRMAIR